MRPLVLAGLAAGLLALHAPAASADHVGARCRVNSIQQTTLTGADRWEGVALGWAYANHDTVTVRCVVYVNGVEAASTTPGDPAPVVAVTAGRVSYTRSLADTTQLCAVATTRHGEQRRCNPAVGGPVPPHWVTDVTDWTFGQVGDVVAEHVEPPACAALGALSPGTPPVSIDPGGDVYVDGELWWDCPPYAEWP